MTAIARAIGASTARTFGALAITFAAGTVTPYVYSRTIGRAIGWIKAKSSKDE